MFIVTDLVSLIIPLYSIIAMFIIRQKLRDETSYILVSNGTRREKTCLQGFANNTGADQPAHPRRLISAFVIRFLESIISRLATSEILIF